MGAAEGKPAGVIEQWALKVTAFSSQYNSNGWSANAVLGPPKVYPRYGDITGTWAPGKIDDKQYIEMSFETAVFVSAINIYETFNSGGVKRVSVRSPGGAWETVWETSKSQHLTTSRIFSPEIKCPGYRTKGVRLDVDCSVSESWVEIDAVQLVGRKLKIECPHPLPLLSQDLAKLVNDQATSDVTLIAGDKLLYAHKAILSARSQFFKDLLAGSGQGDRITVPGISYRGLHGMQHFLYSGNIPAEWGAGALVDVWRADSKVGVPGLQGFCVTMIDDKLDCDNVVNVFVNATETLPVSDDIREVCLDFMSTHMSAVSKSPEFKALSKSLMLEIIQLTTAKMTL